MSKVLAPNLSSQTHSNSMIG
uniref:Uncharacterized protein n=1 Tax=Arundo donax TaxID=35708 RepID=A0A0A8ZH63_ARUDO